MSINTPCQTQPDDVEPTSGDLAAIEAEWPQIAAECDLVAAECRVLANPSDVLARRAHRRAMNALNRLLVQQVNHDAAEVAPVSTLTYFDPADPVEAA